MKKIWTWIIIENKRILLIKRKYNKKSNPNFWAFPWWRNESNETMEETAIREVKEEVWLNFIPTKLFEYNKNDTIHFHRYLWKYSGNIKIQDEECDWYWWFTYDETNKILISENMKNLLYELHKHKLI